MWNAVEFATSYLQHSVPQMEICDLELPHRPLAALGRRLFPLPGTETKGPIPGAGELPIAIATAPTALEEVEQIAARIKADVRQARVAGCSMRLSDVAVIIPGPGYDPLIREVFSRAGLPFNLAGRALDLASSRPARLLLSALAVIGGQWRADLLLDFLMQPVVRRRLVQGKRLHALFEERPRQRQQLDFGVWSRAWNHISTTGKTSSLGSASAGRRREACHRPGPKPRADHASGSVPGWPWTSSMLGAIVAAPRFQWI